MDEDAHLEAIRASGYDQQVVRAYAEWLVEQGFDSGKYLLSELERLATQEKLAKLNIEIAEAVAWDSLSLEWLDSVLPLKIDAPMVGTFYANYNFIEPDYVKLGDRIEIGDEVCVIEATKVFNVITARHSGFVSDILVAHGDVVEYGQPLFKLRRAL